MTPIYFSNNTLNKKPIVHSLSLSSHGVLLSSCKLWRNWSYTLGLQVIEFHAGIFKLLLRCYQTDWRGWWEACGKGQQKTHFSCVCLVLCCVCVSYSLSFITKYSIIARFRSLCKKIFIISGWCYFYLSLVGILQEVGPWYDGKLPPFVDIYSLRLAKLFTELTTRKLWCWQVYLWRVMMSYWQIWMLKWHLKEMNG